MDYKNMTVVDLKPLMKERGSRGYSRLNKAELIAFIWNDLQPRTRPPPRPIPDLRPPPRPIPIPRPPRRPIPAPRPPPRPIPAPHSRPPPSPPVRPYQLKPNREKVIEPPVEWSPPAPPPPPH